MRDKLKNGSILRRRFRAGGFSLIELMIALLISLLIIAAVGYIYVGNRNAYRTQSADSRLTDNARVAIEFLSRDLRLAAKFGCSRVDLKDINRIEGSVIITAKLPLMAAQTDAELDSLLIPKADIGGVSTYQLLEPGRMIRSYDGGANFTGITLLPSSPRRPNTDVLEIMKVGYTASHLAKPMVTENSDLLLESILPGAAPGGSDMHTFLVSDCAYAEIIKGRINTSSIATGGALKIDNPAWNNNGRIARPGDVYATDATVALLEPVIYMVQNPSAASSVQTPRLVRFGITAKPEPDKTGEWSAAGSPEIIADGIEDLQIRFGVATAGGTANAPDQYMTATQIDAAGANMWRNVRSAEITLTVISERSTASTTATNQINNASVDTRLRQQITHVVSLRNAQQ